jgi:hypothetical protein
MKPTGLRVEFYKDVQGKWRWTQYAGNGLIRSASSESFEERHAAWENWRAGIIEAQNIHDDALVYIRDEAGNRHRSR